MITIYGLAEQQSANAKFVTLKELGTQAIQDKALKLTRIKNDLYWDYLPAIQLLCLGGVNAAFNTRRSVLLRIISLAFFTQGSTGILCTKLKQMKIDHRVKKLELLKPHLSNNNFLAYVSAEKEKHPRLKTSELLAHQEIFKRISLNDSYSAFYRERFPPL